MLSASRTAHAFRRPLAAAAIAAAACLTVTPIVSPHNALVESAGAQAGVQRIHLAAAAVVA